MPAGRAERSGPAGHVRRALAELAERGIVRSVDIGPDNSVASTKVADARITYSGTGALADANAPGLLSRFFNFSWFPF